MSAKAPSPMPEGRRPPPPPAPPRAANEASPLEQLILDAVKEALDKRIPTLASVGLNPRRYVHPSIAWLVTGYTEKAIQQKIDAGVWREGREWIKAPDGRRLVDLEGYDRWVESGRPGDSR